VRARAGLVPDARPGHRSLDLHHSGHAIDLEGCARRPGATLTDSDASIFYLWGAITDPNYTQTNQVLATYRLQLQNRAILQGPPPYANCP
jgi:hypothetical protein